jgi:hypothetical protein
MSIPNEYSIFCEGGCGCHNVIPICPDCCFDIAVAAGANPSKVIEVMKSKNIDTDYIERYKLSE